MSFPFKNIVWDSEFYQALSGKDGWSQLFDCVGMHFDRLMQHHFQWFGRKQGHVEIPLDLCMTVVTDRGLTMIRWWLEHDLSYPPSQVSEWFIQLVRPSLDQLLSIQAENQRL